MKTTEAYLSADGALHLNEKDAKERDENMLGEALDGLLKLFELDISRSQEYKALLCIMKKRAALAAAIAEIRVVLEHGESE